MTLALVLFLAAAVTTWLSTFGYLGILRLLARQPNSTGAAALPPVAIVIPIHQDEELLAAKLADLAETDYPSDRLSIVVASRSASARATTAIENAAARGVTVALLRFEEAANKMDQVLLALHQLEQELVVVTDVDSRLERGCVRALVRAFAEDPATALVGAAVVPQTRLLEELLHWKLLNTLWWLEGEALAAGMFSGVCYAVRREEVLRLVKACPEPIAEDAHLALVLAHAGRACRLLPTARASELRVPQTTAQLLEFRRRRGRAYLAALRHRMTFPDSRSGPRLIRLVRLWHFLVTPWLVPITALLGLGLLLTPRWPWPAGAGAAFVLPAVFLLARTGSDGGTPASLRRRCVATARLLALTWYAMVRLALWGRESAGPVEGRCYAEDI